MRNKFKIITIKKYFVNFANFDGKTKLLKNCCVRMHCCIKHNLVLFTYTYKRIIEIILIFFIPICLRMFTLSNFHAFSLAGLLISEPSNISSDFDNGNIHYPTFLKTVAESLISEPSTIAPITPVPTLNHNPSEEVSVPEPIPEPIPESTESVPLTLNETQNTTESQITINDVFQHYMKYMENTDTNAEDMKIKSLAYAKEIFTKEEWAANVDELKNQNHIVSQFLSALDVLHSEIEPTQKLYLCHLKTAVGLQNSLSASQKEITPDNLIKALTIYSNALNQYLIQ